MGYSNRNRYRSSASSKQQDTPTVFHTASTQMTKEERRAARQARRAERAAQSDEAAMLARNISKRSDGVATGTRSTNAVNGSANDGAGRKPEKQNKKMSKHPAKWHASGGVMINKMKVLGGMFYAGSDMSGMVEPTLYEPSLVSPVWNVARNTDGLTETTQYLTYEYLTPTQRRAYLEFLASNRKQVDDIGYVFLYVYGLERRLLIDTRKPGTVTPEERSMVVKEVARLLRCFGKRSKSLSKYLRLLLLYDGTVFSIYNEKQIRQLFEVESDYLEWTDNSDAMIYLLIARYLENGIQINLNHVFEYARQRLIRTRLGSMINITRDDLYNETVTTISKERIRHAGLNMTVNIAEPTNTHVESRPTYYPSSVSLRRRSFEVNTSVCLDIENIGIDFKAIADIILASLYDYRRTQDVLNTASLRGLEDMPLDALRACLPQSMLEEMAGLIGGRERLADIRLNDLPPTIKKGIGYTLKTSQNGLFNQSALDVVSTLYSSIGWQCCSQSTIDDPLTGAWRFKTDGRNVLFKRGYMRSRGNGKQVLAPVFGNDRAESSLTIPESWNEAMALAYIYAWFLQQLGDDATGEDLSKITPSSYPPFTRRNKQAQIIVFFGFLYATYYADLSNHGLKPACQRTSISKVQSEIFSLCMDKYGYQLPTHAFDAIKKIYDKYPNADANNILYDYHAGDYRISYDVDSEVEFVIDASKIQKTIRETSDVHRILEGAFIDEDDDETTDAAASVSEDGTDMVNLSSNDDTVAFSRDSSTASDTDNNGNVAVNKNNDADDEAIPDNISTAWNIVKQVFGDDDETEFEALRIAFVNAGLAETIGDVTALITSINELIGDGDELIEVDGGDVYLNGE